VVSLLIKATEIVHDLAYRFMYGRANDQRHLLILTSDRLWLARPPMAVHQLRNVGGLQFHHVKGAIRPKERDVQDVSDSKLLTPRLAYVPTAEHPCHELELRVKITTFLAVRVFDESS